MKSVLMLDTSIATLNIGDEIINASIKKNWQEIFRENYILNLPTHTLQYSWLQKLWYKDKMNVYKNADYKFLCGTNALYTNMLRPLPAWNINLCNSQLLQNTICMGVGIGENSKSCNWYTRKLYDKVLSHDFIHSVRDQKAQHFLESLGFKVINTGCPTLWGLTDEHCKNIPASKAPNVVFTLTYYLRDEENDRRMVECLKRNYENVYFWPQCYADYDYLRSLCDCADIKVLPANLMAYDELLQTNIDYIGNRLHGGIYALQHSCRTIILEIDYRLREMKGIYTLPSLKREEVAEELDAMINSSWETKPIGINFENVEKWKSQFR